MCGGVGRSVRRPLKALIRVVGGGAVVTVRGQSSHWGEGREGGSEGGGRQEWRLHWPGLWGHKMVTCGARRALVQQLAVTVTVWTNSPNCSLYWGTGEKAVWLP